ncbi:MAG: hypothetical protein KCHDKBKB_02449 [Elusimicrobia bacterium]|nr:hypothetical protein [Elusimicrobiota bacterium]
MLVTVWFCVPVKRTVEVFTLKLPPVRDKLPFNVTTLVPRLMVPVFWLKALDTVKS